MSPCVVTGIGDTKSIICQFRNSGEEEQVASIVKVIEKRGHFPMNKGKEKLGEEI